MALARELGDTAVPLLTRKLKTGADEHASWAYFLLSQLGGERVVAAARAIVSDDATPDDRKALALALLSELGAELPDEVRLQDPERLRQSSVGELVARLSEPADVARAADLLVEQVVPTELGQFVREMVDAGGRGARAGSLTPLVDELLARDDLDPGAVGELVALRAGLPAPAPLARAAGRATAWLGRRDDGAMCVLATRHPGPGARRRALVVELDADSLLTGGSHHAELGERGGVRVLGDALRARGYLLRRIRARDATGLVARAACATRVAGRRLPRAYFLGRDLLGLSREHLAAELALAAESALARAEALIEVGQPAVAAPILRAHVEEHPDDADGRALYGACLLAIDQPEAALPQLAVAARLEPDEPLHHWNLSHAAKRCDKMGACYLALRRYLAAGDESDGARERAEIARRFMRLFERFAALEHPDASVENVARSEELFERACVHLDAERLTEAQSGFEAVLKLVPSHYQSWSNLGVVHLVQKRRGEAEKCLRRALELKPDYEVAVKNLALMTRR